MRPNLRWGGLRWGGGLSPARGGRAAAPLAALALALALGCAHAPLPTAPDARAPDAVRAAYYEAHAPRLPAPAPALFFATPLRLRDGAWVEPADLAPAVDGDSHTARAIAHYELAQTSFLACFGAGAGLVALGTSSWAVWGGLALASAPKPVTDGVFIGGRIAQVTGVTALAVAALVLGPAARDARDDAFRSYDSSLRARLGLP